MKSGSWGINEGSVLVFAWDHRKPQKHQSESPVPGQDSNYGPPKEKSESSQLVQFQFFWHFIIVERKKNTPFCSANQSFWVWSYANTKQTIHTFNTSETSHTQHHIQSSCSFHKALNITKIIFYIQTATHKLSVGRIQLARDYLAFKQHARMSTFHHAWQHVISRQQKLLSSGIFRWDIPVAFSNQWNIYIISQSNTTFIK